MHGIGHTDHRAELLASLRRLEEALARHEHSVGDGGAEGVELAVLRRSVAMLHEEADRIRELLAAG